MVDAPIPAIETGVTPNPLAPRSEVDGIQLERQAKQLIVGNWLSQAEVASQELNDAWSAYNAAYNF